MVERSGPSYCIRVAVRRICRIGGIALFLVGLLSGAPSVASDHNSLAGTWHLVSYVDRVEAGSPIYAFGTKPIGVFNFAADGYASVSIMRNPPDVAAGTEDPHPDACVPVWYCSNFGPCTVDVNHGRYVIRVVRTNIPRFLGTDQERPFSRQGDTLVISETYMGGTQTIRAERTLIRERLKK